MILRVLTASVLIPLVVAAIFLLPGWWFLLFVVVVMELAALELVRICRHWAPRAPLAALLVLMPAAALALAAALDPAAAEIPGAPLLAAAVLLGPAAGLWLLFGRTPVDQILPALGALTYGGLSLALAAASGWRLRQLDPWLLILLLLIIALGDSFAQLVGSLAGRRKLAPVVSPNKTWEGAVAGFLAAAAVTAGWSLWRLGEVDPRLLALAALVSAVGQCGDLVESMLKRGAGIKDSGNLLPGHGGMLDRTDSFVFAAPVFLLGLTLLGLETVLR